MDILRLFYHQNTARTNPIITQSFNQSIFVMFCLITLKYLPFTFNCHFCTDDLLHKIIF